jgi:hypothetical protein
MNAKLGNTSTLGGHRNMERFELDRLFGMALTDARFFDHLKKYPHKVIERFELTESEAQAVLRIAPAARSTEDLALQLDSWMTEAASPAVEPSQEPQFVGFDSAVQQLSLSGDQILTMIQEGRIRLSAQDISQIAFHITDKEYA